MTKITHVLSVPLTPADADAALKLRAEIDAICARDDSLGVAIGPADEIALKGVSEVQLDNAVGFLKRHAGPDFKVGGLQVLYIETITRTIDWQYAHKKQSGGSGQYAKVKIRFAPGESGSGFLFVNQAGASVPAAFVEGVEQGLAQAGQHGPVAGFTVMDVLCTLLDGAYHEIDSSALTFQIAASACLREALPKASPRILEPMMLVVALTPPKYMGDVIGDLNSRGGQVDGMERLGRFQAIAARVPLANLFGYDSTLKSMTRGTATYTMEFDHYEQIPPIRPDDGGDTFPPAVGKRA
jgi:elongation factor G